MFEYIKSTYKVGDGVKVRCPRGVIKGQIVFLSGDTICVIDNAQKRHILKGSDIDYCEDYDGSDVEENDMSKQQKQLPVNANNRKKTESCENSTTQPAKRNLTDEEESEVEELVNFFKKKGYTHSSEVSNYIRNHNLGYKFPHISGYLDLSSGEDNWTFEGGISPKYYAIICDRLGLRDKGTFAKVTGFKSYDEDKRG